MMSQTAIPQTVGNDEPAAQPPAGAERAFVDLSRYDNSEYDPGRGLLIRAVWCFVSLALFEGGWFPVRRLKVCLLRLFGARIGRGLVIKPGVRIKHPWRLRIGDHCWLGQDAWIDNLTDVRIGDHVCISQGVYLCTGSHDPRDPRFGLITRPIQIGTGAWIGARSVILGGVTIGSNAVIAAGSVVTKDVTQWSVVGGNPARTIAAERVDSRPHNPPSGTSTAFDS